MSIERLLKLYVQALSHKVRTPLGVIANDLQFFRQNLGEGEIDRSLDKCRIISSLLKCPSTDHMVAEEISIEELSKLTGRSVVSEVNLTLPSLVAEAIRLVAASVESETIELSKDVNKWEANFCLQQPEDSSNHHPTYSSISEFFSDELAVDSLEAPLLDAKLIDADIDLLISLTPTDLRMEFGFR